ncbi:hypothetical protein M3205_16745 [Cytobacillus firmus]|uniref:hypothetical protein n=1 Tax=Cytobacillus firmus TaxID=1399 RepID=UPI00203B48B2|nr:hypothetical protein [Cytobacillus firmus]MCM3707361.1 hypothetical protein [Cytobacillus firmus]
MVKLARARAAGKVARGHSIRRRGMSLEAKNELLSNQIAKAMFKNNTEALKVNKDGVVTNLDYNNPNHMRWLED